MNRDIARSFLELLGDMFLVAGVPFFLMRGTALGAYRDKDFTPTERDIDIGILMERFEVHQLVRPLVQFGVEVNTFNRHHRRATHTIVCQWRGVKADLVGWYKSADGKERYAVAPTDVSPHYCIVHPAELIETTQQVELFGRTWNIPSPIETYLEREYGPDWKTPREDHVSRARVYGYKEMSLA